jgi:hypothetical protein
MEDPAPCVRPVSATLMPDCSIRSEDFLFRVGIEPRAIDHFGPPVSSAVLTIYPTSPSSRREPPSRRTIGTRLGQSQGAVARSAETA